MRAGDQAKAFDDRYREALERIERDHPDYRLYEVHPAFGVRGVDEDWPTTFEPGDLGTAWLERDRGVQRRKRAEFVDLLLRWARGEGECRFELRRRAGRGRRRGVARGWRRAWGEVTGTLDDEAAAMLARGRFRRLHIFIDTGSGRGSPRSAGETSPTSESDVLRIVAVRGWSRCGVWLDLPQLRELAPRVAALRAADEPDEPRVRNIWRARLARAWPRGAQAIAAVVAAGPALALEHGMVRLMIFMAVVTGVRIALIPVEGRVYRWCGIEAEHDG